MKMIYEIPMLFVTDIACEDIVTASPGGWQDGDNDLNWGAPWNANEGD